MPTATAGEAAAMRSPALRLLLLEDDPVGAEWLRHLLARWGYAVEHAADCRQALALADTRVFDGLLLDQRLPDGSGESLLAALRSAGHRAPALALSADVEICHAASSAEPARFDARLRKPVAIDALLSALHDLKLTPPAWDEQRALTAANGHAAIARSLRQLMLAELPSQRAELARIRAHTPNDASALDALLHRLLGSARLTGALALAAHIDSARSVIAEPLAGAQGAAALDLLDTEMERLLSEASAPH